MVSYACNCVGPRPGGPLCPCQMRGVIERDGRYILPERDLGPVARAEFRDILERGRIGQSLRSR